MFEKDLKIGSLLLIYGGVLSDERRDVLEQYYNEDYSLSEIADNVGISRQGIRALIKKGEAELRMLDERLGLFSKYERISACADIISESDIYKQLPDEIKNAINEIADISKGISKG